MIYLLQILALGGKNQELVIYFLGLYCTCCYPGLMAVFLSVHNSRTSVHTLHIIHKINTFNIKGTYEESRTYIDNLFSLIFKSTENGVLDNIIMWEMSDIPNILDCLDLPEVLDIFNIIDIRNFLWLLGNLLASSRTSFTSYSI